MNKERPTHLCSLGIDPRDPSAIIQAQADRIAELEEALDEVAAAALDRSNERDRYREALCRYGRHDDKCHFSQVSHSNNAATTQTCTCGLSALEEA